LAIHSARTDEATIKYHLDLAHTYLGMPMLSALLGVFAARLGDRKRALQLFEEGIVSHLQDPFMQFTESARAFEGHGSEYSYTGDTVFLTNPAGFLMSLMFGLPGMQLGRGEPNSWMKHPVVMPAGWDAIEVERVWVRGAPKRMTARHGASHTTLDAIS